MIIKVQAKQLWLSLILNLFISTNNHVLNPVPIKIITDTGYFHSETNANEFLKIKRQPAKINGPKALKFLAGKCYNFEPKDYQYQVCPFHNITQHEIKAHWNQYQGILGIWSGYWSISNNTFQEMLYTEGDECSNSNINKKVTIKFECGHFEKVIEVLEPKVCEYQVKFQTKAVCDKHALTVYPQLNQTFKNEWNEIKTLYANNLVTQKFYEQKLNKILVKSGFMQNNTEWSENIDLNFETLEKCKLAYMLKLANKKF